MRPEIDYTRQRTVAELLAEHGEAGGPGRRNRRRGDDPERPVRPPNGPSGAPPHVPGGGRGVREPGPPPAAPRDPAYRGAPRSGPVPGRRDRPTEMIGDRQRPTGPSGTAGHAAGAQRGGAAERAATSGPLRAVPSGPRDVPGRAAASGPLRAVPPIAPGGHDGPPAGGRAPGPTSGGPQSFGPGTHDAAPSSGRPATGPWAPARPASPWEPYRGTAGGPGRPHPLPDRPTGAGWERREPVARPFLPATPMPVSHRSAASPARGPAPHGSRPERVPDPGPSTGAYDPFEFDDEDDDGPRTVIGTEAAQRGRTPRRDGFPTLMDGPATALDLGGRRADQAGRARPGDGPATQLDVAGLRRGDGPATDFDVNGRPDRGDGPATDFDVTAFDVTGRPGPRAVPAEAARPAVLRPSFGAASRSRPPAAPVPTPPRVRPFAQKVVDGPTELTDNRLDELEQLDDRTDVAAPRRVPTAPPPFREARRRTAEELDADDEPFGLADPHGDGIAGLGGRFDLDDADVDEQHERHPADLDDVDRDDLDERAFDDTDDDTDGDGDDEPGATRPAQAWAGVVAQWLAGAVAGAVLWVAFRYLWRELPVVALAAAVLVTVGLVLLVRQLLHHVDRRTTGFAVAVGLLLTASPAVLVLLGR